MFATLPDLNSHRQSLASSLPPAAVPILIVAATLLAYAATLQFDFVYDDIGQIVANPYIQHWRFARYYFTGHVWALLFPGSQGNYYRPLFLLWLLLNHTLFGLRAWGWHLTSVAAHALATFLVFRLTMRLSDDRWLAGVTALLFGLHPVHIESVGWISAIPDPLAAIFLLSAFLCFLEFHRSKHFRWTALSALLFAAALLVKETTAVLPAVIAVYAWLFPSRPDEPRTLVPRLSSVLLSVLPYLAVFAIYLPLRIRALHGAYHAGNLPLRVHLLTLPSVLWFYLRHLFWPFRLSVFYDLPVVTSPRLPDFWLPLAGLAVACAMTFLWWRRTGNNLVPFAAAWTALLIVPVLNLPALPSAYDLVHDRYLYLPSVGFCLLLASLLARLNVPRARRMAWATMAALAVATIWCAATMVQSLYWASNTVLFYRAIELAPGSVPAWNNLAESFVRQGKYESAITLYEHVLKSDPDAWLAQTNMGLCLYRLGRPAEAKPYLLRAIQINPANDDAFYYLGQVHAALGDLSQAESLMKRAIEIEPRTAGYRFGLGLVLKREGKLDEALQYFRDELARDPSNSAARQEITTIEQQPR